MRRDTSLAVVSVPSDFPVPVMEITKSAMASISPIRATLLCVNALLLMYFTRDDMAHLSLW